MKQRRKLLISAHSENVLFIKVLKWSGLVRGVGVWRWVVGGIEKSMRVGCRWVTRVDRAGHR